MRVGLFLYYHQNVQCKKCGGRLDSDRFVHCAMCRAAKATYMREYMKDPVRLEKRRAYDIERANHPDRDAYMQNYQRKWAQHPDNVAKRKAWFDANPDKKREIALKYVHRKREDPEFKAVEQERSRAYLQTPEGRATSARGLARRRIWSQDGDAWANRQSYMLIERPPCASCNTSFKRSHQLDHIIPLAFGGPLGTQGLDTEENWQPLCLQCHRRKTTSDLARIKRMKRLLTQITY